MEKLRLEQKILFKVGIELLEVALRKYIFIPFTKIRVNFAGKIFRRVVFRIWIRYTEFHQHLAVNY